jgi:hypothetical protein
MLEKLMLQVMPLNQRLQIRRQEWQIFSKELKILVGTILNNPHSYEE